MYTYVAVTGRERSLFLSPFDHIFNNFYLSAKSISRLGLKYESIHAGRLIQLKKRNRDSVHFLTVTATYTVNLHKHH